VLTASVAQRLGISAEKLTEPEQELQLQGRQVKVKPALLETFQLGSAVVKQVPAVVLPAEAEDLGSFLPLESLPGYRLQPLPRQMLLRVSPDSSQ
jgi:predicted aspartyl protease